jgi:ABC-type Fe3+-hydroxamate transport system substrate-binding protein
MRSARLLFFGLIFLITACSTNASATTNTASLDVAIKLPVAALPGYEVSVFTQNDSRVLVSNPDSVAVEPQPCDRQDRVGEQRHADPHAGPHA